MSDHPPSLPATDQVAPARIPALLPLVVDVPRYEPAQPGNPTSGGGVGLLQMQLGTGDPHRAADLIQGASLGLAAATLELQTLRDELAKSSQAQRVERVRFKLEQTRAEVEQLRQAIKAAPGRIREALEQEDNDAALTTAAGLERTEAVQSARLSLLERRANMLAGMLERAEADERRHFWETFRARRQEWLDQVVRQYQIAALELGQLMEPCLGALLVLQGRYQAFQRIEDVEAKHFARNPDPETRAELAAQHDRAMAEQKRINDKERQAELDRALAAERRAEARKGRPETGPRDQFTTDYPTHDLVPMEARIR